MKLFRKIIIFVLAAAFVIAALTGCGSKVDADEIIKNIKAAEQTVTASEGTMYVKYDMTASASSLELSFNLEMNAELQNTKDVGHVLLTMKAQVLGQDKTSDIESYYVKGEDGLVLYSKTDDEPWTCEDADNQISPDLVSVAGAIFDTDINFKYNKTEKYNNMDCYVLSAEVTGDMFKKIASTASTDSFSSFDGVDLSGATMPVVLFVNKEDNLVYKIEIDLTSVIKKAITSATDMPEGAKINIDEAVVIYEVDSYNTIDSIEIPDEVLAVNDSDPIEEPTDSDDTDEDTEIDANGNYILRSIFDAGDYLILTCPEGFEPSYTSQYYIDFVSQNDEDLSYEWSIEEMAYTSADDLAAYCVDYAKEIRDDDTFEYTDVTDIPLNTITINGMEVSYNGVSYILYGKPARIIHAWTPGTDSYASCQIYQMLFDETSDFADITADVTNAFSNLAFGGAEPEAPAADTEAEAQ